MNPRSNYPYSVSLHELARTIVALARCLRWLRFLERNNAWICSSAAVSLALF